MRLCTPQDFSRPVSIVKINSDRRHAPAEFIDRDGVINALVNREEKWVSPRKTSEFNLIPGLIVRICPHDNSDDCQCHKPKPGLTTECLEEFMIDSTRFWMIGDRISDLQAGIAGGCQVAFIESEQETLPIDNTWNEIYSFSNLLEFSKYLESIAPHN